LDSKKGEIMTTRDFLIEDMENAVEDAPENSAFACERCNKFYVYEDALANNFSCCGQHLNELQEQGAMS
jgi:transcription initiation factor IIE alpha subunit